MIIGIGIDIVEIQRVEKLAKKQSRFVERILTDKEQSMYNNYSPNRKIEFLAGRFAAKEAFVKAVGTGISREYSWQDIEILSDERGKPLLLATVEGSVHLSISHSESYAVAQVIIERLSS
ncbi:holo-ACP synthase [Bacillus solitudinis]|uniref:holo-ACP synthase n=1 Tax=Bacillus solitudinis TaxID=2014074 RepID=UPI000C230590|nr:holo-ACP synthase [Bacillus solitudinis]